MDTASLRTAALWGSLGVIIQPGLANAYPELIGILDAIHAKAAQWPWVPADWLAKVRAEQALEPMDLVIVAPSKMGNGTTQTNLPAWLRSNQERVDLWQKLRNESTGAVSKYAAGQAAAGKAQLDALYARAAFWNEGFGSTLISAAETIRDLPGTVVSAVGSGALAVLGAFMKKAWWVIALVILGWLLWMNRGKVMSRAAKAAGGVL